MTQLVVGYYLPCHLPIQAASICVRRDPAGRVTFRLSISRPSTDALTGSAWQSRVRRPLLTSLYSF